MCPKYDKTPFKWESIPQENIKTHEQLTYFYQDAWKEITADYQAYFPDESVVAWRKEQLSNLNKLKTELEKKITTQPVETEEPKIDELQTPRYIGTPDMGKKTVIPTHEETSAKPELENALSDAIDHLLQLCEHSDYDGDKFMIPLGRHESYEAKGLTGLTQDELDLFMSKFSELMNTPIAAIFHEGGFWHVPDEILIDLGISPDTVAKLQGRSSTTSSTTPPEPELMDVLSTKEVPSPSPQSPAKMEQKPITGKSEEIPAKKVETTIEKIPTVVPKVTIKKEPPPLEDMLDAAKGKGSTTFPESSTERQALREKCDSYIQELKQFDDVQKKFGEATQKKGFLFKHNLERQDPERPRQIRELQAAIDNAMNDIKIAKGKYHKGDPKEFEKAINKAILELQKSVIHLGIKHPTIEKGTSRLVNVIRDLEKATKIDLLPPEKTAKVKNKKI